MTQLPVDKFGEQALCVTTRPPLARDVTEGGMGGGGAIVVGAAIIRHCLIDFSCVECL
jgi:hypothetical protein